MCADLCESQREKERNNETKIESTTCEEKKRNTQIVIIGHGYRVNITTQHFDLVLPQTH